MTGTTGTGTTGIGTTGTGTTGTGMGGAVRRVLVVCLGNICRSPMGEAALRRAAGEAGLALEVDSAGTGAWHEGEPPHPTALSVAAGRGYDNAALRARKVTAEDFDRFDLILGMDASNLANLERVRPEGSHARLAAFDAGADVPDPYGRPVAAYEAVLDQIEAAARAWAARLAG